MAQHDVGVNQGRTLPDYLGLFANVLYLLAGLSFLGGLLIDWLPTGSFYITPLVITNQEPFNSGLFIVAIALLLLGYFLSTLGDWIEEYRRESFDQTQEWTVDVGNR